MAKKFVRGITDIKTINNQDLDTNNVNDLLSDGKHNYIHRKKSDGSEEYHNLTNNLKNLQSDDTDLLTVTNYNNTTNSATIRPKHDSQKEQLLESTDNTIVITHGENGTEETTNVDVNPEIVLEHNNLVSNSDYVTIEHEEGSNTSQIKTDNLESELDDIKAIIPKSLGGRNILRGTQEMTIGSGNWTTGTWRKSGIGTYEQVTVSDSPIPSISKGIKLTITDESQEVGCVQDVYNLISGTYTQSVWVKGTAGAKVRLQPFYNNERHSETKFFTLDGTWQRVSLTVNNSTSDNYSIGFVYLSDSPIDSTVTVLANYMDSADTICDWKPATEDNDSKLAQKQNTITNNTSIGVNGEYGTGLRQLYTKSQTYTHANGIFKTYVKSVANSSSVSNLEEEFNFLAKMNKSQTSADFTLNAHDTAVFQYLIDTYGVDNKINVCGSAFTLNGSNLNFNTNGAQYNPHIINFNDIIPTSAINVTQ